MSVVADDVAYLHVPKTGGISCRHYLLDHVPGAVDSVFHDHSPLPQAHVPVRDLPHWTGRPLASWRRIVATVRDPFAQQLSLWYHWRDAYARGGRRPLERVAALYPELSHWLMDPHGDWPLFYETRHKGGWASETEAWRWIQTMGYYEWFLTVDGQVPENVALVRFEHLAEEFPAAMAPFVDGRPPLEHHNPSRERTTHGYYTEFGIQVVRDKFHWAFGCLFDHERPEGA